jgi:hypothetical protein
LLVAIQGIAVAPSRMPSNSGRLTTLGAIATGEVANWGLNPIFAHDRMMRELNPPSPTSNRAWTPAFFAL